MQDLACAAGREAYNLRDLGRTAVQIVHSISQQQVSRACDSTRLTPVSYTHLTLPTIYSV